VEVVFVLIVTDGSTWYECRTFRDQEEWSAAVCAARLARWRVWTIALDVGKDFSK
jgi:hypothetical protein